MQNNVEYDPETNTYWVVHDHADRVSLSTTIVLAIEEVVPDEADSKPLYDVVDPDALNAIFRPRSEFAPSRDGRVQFTISDHRVTVHADGLIEIDPPAEE